MRRKASHDTGVHRYLQALGVLQQSPDEIERAEREYWNQVKRKWKKERVKKVRSFTVSFSHDEAKEMTESAASHNMSRPKFIKGVCLAYMQRKYLVPDTESVQSIKTLLSLNYSALQELYELEKVPPFIALELLQRMELLERMVLQQLTHPKPSEDDH